MTSRKNRRDMAACSRKLLNSKGRQYGREASVPRSGHPRAARKMFLIIHAYFGCTGSVLVHFGSYTGYHFEHFLGGFF